MALFNSIFGRVVSASIVRSRRAAAVSRGTISLGQLPFSTATATDNYCGEQSVVELEGRAFEVKDDEEDGTPYLQCKYGRDEIITIRVDKTNSGVRGFQVKDDEDNGTTPYLECKYDQLDDEIIKVRVNQTNSTRKKANGHPMLVEINYGNNHDKLLTFKIKAFPHWIYVPRWSLSNGESGDLGDFQKYFDKRGINLGMTNFLFNHISHRNHKANSIVGSYNSALGRRQPPFSTMGSSTEEDIIKALETNYDQMNIISADQHEQSGRNEESDDKTSVVPDGVNKESDSVNILDPNYTNKGCSSIPDILRAIPDEFSIPEISMRREFQGELISIDVDYIEEEEEDQVNPDINHLVLDVCTMKEIAKGLYHDFKFDLTASTDHLALHKITATHLGHQPGIPQHCKHLDGFEKFLAERGISPSVTNFILDYIPIKKLLDYVNSKKQESRSYPKMLKVLDCSKLPNFKVGSRFLGGGPCEVKAFPNGFYLSELYLERKYRDEELNVYISDNVRDKEVGISVTEYKSNNESFFTELVAHPEYREKMQVLETWSKWNEEDEHEVERLPLRHFEKRGIRSSWTDIVFNHLNDNQPHRNQLLNALRILARTSTLYVPR